MALLDRLNPIPRTRAHSEAMLKESPRGLEFACAAVLAVLSGMILWSVVMYEWFLVTYRQFYQQLNHSERLYALTEEGCEVLLALWMVVLAANVARAGARRDRGLFGPVALRIWGAIFAALPGLAIVLLHGRADYHMIAFFWTAAIACFTLASRRAKLAAARAAAPVLMRAAYGPPPPIE